MNGEVNFILSRCYWTDRCFSSWTAPGEVSVCFGGILSDPVSQSTNKIWQAVAPASFSAHCISICDRTIILCPTGWQDSHRDSDQRHAAVWQHLPVACWWTCLGTSSLSINLDSLCQVSVIPSNIMSSHVRNYQASKYVPSSLMKAHHTISMRKSL